MYTVVPEVIMLKRGAQTTKSSKIIRIFLYILIFRFYFTLALTVNLMVSIFERMSVSKRAVGQ